MQVGTRPGFGWISQYLFNWRPGSGLRIRLLIRILNTYLRIRNALPPVDDRAEVQVGLVNAGPLHHRSELVQYLGYV